LFWSSDAKIGYVPQKLLGSKRFTDYSFGIFENLKNLTIKKLRKVLALVGIKQKAEHIHHDIRVLNTYLGSLSGWRTPANSNGLCAFGKP